MKTEDITYIPNFLTKEESDFLFEHLSKDIAWTNEVIAPSGETVKLNRKVAYIADEEREYFYANLRFQTPNGTWSPPLLKLRDRLNKTYGTKFNSVLLNFYKDGKDLINWHSDKEYCLGTNPVIASINLGATRKFWLLEKKENGQKWNIPLNHGDLLFMNKDCQKNLLHAILKEKEVTEPRISLTFRHCNLIG